MSVEFEELHIKVTFSENQPELKDKVGSIISNAGMVLLHPFMDKLFKDLGLLEGKQFVGDIAGEHAACLWHYMATGSENVTEIDLMLPGLLCGIRLESVHRISLPVSSYEKEICTRHLIRILEYWELASNIEELRRNFLRRGGVLEKHVEYWSLQVAQNRADDLVDGTFQSPVVIQQPWQRVALHVHWPKPGV